MTTEKATNYLLSHNQLATVCNNQFPAKTIYKEGQIKTITDTSYLPGDSIPCPPDSAGRVIYVHTKPLIITRTEYKTDTIETGSPFVEAALREENNDLKKKATKYEEDNLRLSKANNRYMIAVVFGIIFIAALTYFKFK